MEKKKQLVHIDLTEDQKKQIREAGVQDAEAIEFTAQELEERISPKPFRN